MSLSQPQAARNRKPKTSVGCLGLSGELKNVVYPVSWDHEVHYDGRLELCRQLPRMCIPF